MKETMKKKERSERKLGLGTILPTAALLGVLVLSPSEGSAQTVSGTQEGTVVTEVTTPTKKTDTTKTVDLESVMQEVKDPTVSGITTTIDGSCIVLGDEDLGEGDDEGIGIEPDPEGDDEGEADEDETSETKESKIGVHGFIQVGNSVVPDFADVCSDKPSAIVCVDAKDPATGLGISIVRMDDFDTDPQHPFSQATVVSPHWDQSFAGGKVSFGVAGQYLLVDKMPGANGLTAKVVGSYSIDDGWTFEGTYFHSFKDGPDVDAFRLGITKKISQALSITAQGRYKSDYTGGVFGRVIVDISMGHGLGVQMSCIAKDGKFIPTAGVAYRF